MGWIDIQRVERWGSPVTAGLAIAARHSVRRSRFHLAIIIVQCTLYACPLLLEHALLQLGNTWIAATRGAQQGG